MAPRTKGFRDPTVMAWFWLFVVSGLLICDAFRVFALSDERFLAILASAQLTILGQASEKILTRLLSAWTALRRS
jgi:hypothetical protein